MKARVPFLNTNLLLRHLTEDNADLSPRASALMQRIATGELIVRTTDTVVFETVYTLQRFYRTPRPRIYAILWPILQLSSVRVAGKRRLQRTFELYVQHAALSFADCFHVAYMESQGLTELISFDRAMDRVQTIMRMEPNDEGQLV